jgi:hypothetical protein
MTLSALGIFSAAGAGGFPDAYELIQTQIVSGSSTASVTFSNLGDYFSTYKHLQLRVVARDTATGFSDSFMKLTFNGATTNLTSHYLSGNGSTVSSAFENTGSAINFGSISAANATANIFGAAIVDILDPFSTTKNTTTRCFDGLVASFTYSNIRSGLWNNTAAVTSINVATGRANFVAGSRLSLYGVK